MTVNNDKLRYQEAAKFFVSFYLAQLGAVHKLCQLGRGESGSPKDDLLHRPYLMKKTMGRGQKLRRHSLWTAPNMAKTYQGRGCPPTANDLNGK